ncbi:MAG: beta-glucosidase [Oscillatoriophycideae cyanobacterium NC_groundwater_1537_Pr4_S-0.65um_50_18]|nr:beta-glucosidase [Oscillatoriophycideae cyanobacterium NC_groundwater_1537_Pr4_S-0.65um_50_18]
MTSAPLSSSLSDWKALSLAEQVAQMIMVRASGHLFDQQIQYPAWEPTAAVLQHWVQDLGVGGVILLGGSAAEVGLRSQQLQGWAQVPLLIAADIEEGVGQRFAGATWFPPPLALGAIARSSLPQAILYAEQMGKTTAQEAQAIGINWLLAPVVDVNNNSANPVINLRAWGETPEMVSQMAQAFIRGAQGYPVLTAAKHFPGHGDTAIDSHLELPLLTHDRSRLAQVEFPPFEAAIAQGVDAVMTAHLQVPSLDARYPATFSAAATQVLRQQMGFEGLIVTDALIMGAITQKYGANEAPVLAIEAGADVLMMPVDLTGAIQAICAAVETGRIALERIHASLERIWQAKQKAGLGVSPEAAAPLHLKLHLEQVGQSSALVSHILKDSMQVYHPERSRLDAPATKPPHNLILLDDGLNSPFLPRQSPAIALPTARGYRLKMVDRHTPTMLLSAEVDDFQPTLLQLFVRSTPFRGTAGLTPIAQSWLYFLIETEQLQALVLYGSPYVLEDLKLQLPSEVPYVFTYGQMPAAQAIALEALWGRSIGEAPAATVTGGEPELKGDRTLLDQTFTDQTFTD